MTIFGVALTVAAFSAACDSKKPTRGAEGSSTAEPGTGNDNRSPDDPNDPSSGDASKKPNSKVEQLAGAYGILNFRQVTSTLSTLTGVQLNAAAPNGGIAPNAEYLRALSSLPTDHTAAAITAGKVASVTKLASTYCDVLANNGALLTAKFPGLNLGAVPADSGAFAKTLVDGFYGPETALQGPRATDIETVKGAVDALKALPGATGTGVFTATCAAIASSAEFFLY